VSSSTLDHEIDGQYRHEAFFYADDDSFMNVTLAFIRDGVDSGEPTLVALNATRIDALRCELDDQADAVKFVDMGDLGGNPARIIPAWQAFLTDHARPGHAVRGMGEPIWASRTPDELAECHRHEALLNVAFDDPNFWLLCPYDTRALDDSVIDAARCTHPFVQQERVSAPSAQFLGTGAMAAPFAEPLAEPEVATVTLAFRHETLRDLRNLVATCASHAGLSDEKSANLVLAAYEIGANSVEHGGGHGTIRIWIDDSDIVCEVRDGGSITDPMLGRVRPPADAQHGRGMWLANQLCDLVQIRSFPAWTVTRLRVRRV
jgi:anti-sigma regulatory factor (Ser/Thr protein kinase)